MRARTSWTDVMDGRLRGLRAAGLTWDAIAASMGLGRNTVLERGRKIGARRNALPALPVEEARDRPTRPAGHPECWALITRETSLAGATYPYPVFL